MKERDILYGNDTYWVMKKGDAYYVMVAGLTHSVSDSAYADMTLAQARVDYFIRTHTDGMNLRRHAALTRSAA